MDTYSLLREVRDLLVVEGNDDDKTLIPLVKSARGYLKNAGVTEPNEGDEDQKALYVHAVATRVKIFFDGDSKGMLDKALSGMILQLKDWR